MKKTVKALSKQLFGAKYESAGKSVLVCGILYFAISSAEIRLTIQPFILYLTSWVFTWCVMGQILHGSRMAEILEGMLKLPFVNRELTFSYVLVLGGYTLITRTMLVWSLFFAAGVWKPIEIITAVLCGAGACLVCAALCLLLKKKKFVLLVAWAACILFVILGVRRSGAVSAVCLLSIVGAVSYLFFADAYAFYNTAAGNKTVHHTGSKGSLTIYLLRYLLANKSYLFNTAGLCAAACFLPVLFREFRGMNILPVGLAILSLNTPICTLLSCDPDLEQCVRSLPGQTGKFFSRYALFIGIINFMVMSIYLGSWQLVIGRVGLANIWMAVLFALQSAFLSVLLEWIYPIRNWKTESDLWHHPRKYLVPVLMLLISAFVSTWTFFIWIWSSVFLIECCAVGYLIRRI